MHYKISHRTSIGSVLRHWKYDPVTDPRIRVLLHNFQLARPAEWKLMPQWHPWSWLLCSDVRSWMVWALNPAMTSSSLNGSFSKQHSRPGEGCICLHLVNLPLHARGGEGRGGGGWWVVVGSWVVRGWGWSGGVGSQSRTSSADTHQPMAHWGKEAFN